MITINNFFNVDYFLNYETGAYLLGASMVLLVIVYIALLKNNSLLVNIILLSASSLLLSICYLLMDAPDVAMTEVALGACLSSCVLLNFIKMINNNSCHEVTNSSPYLAVLLNIALILLLTWAGQDLPRYAQASTPLHNNISAYYIKNTQSDIGITSLVAALLASYRGYDTLGETAVILIAGISVLLLMSNKCVYGQKS